MVERYSRVEMSSKWDLQAKYSAWLKVELAAVKAWNELGLIKKDDCEKILKNAKFDIGRIDEIEKTTKHDVIAFLTSVSENLGAESRFLHYGMTSSDCIDTAVALQVRDSLDLIITDTQNLLKALEKRAFEFKDTLMVGRSHGIHGEPITFGLVLAVWFDEIKHALTLLTNAKECISYGKLSGAMGNFAHAPLEFERKGLQKFRLKASARVKSNHSARQIRPGHLSPCHFSGKLRENRRKYQAFTTHRSV